MSNAYLIYCCDWAVFAAVLVSLELSSLWVWQLRCIILLGHKTILHTTWWNLKVPKRRRVSSDIVSEFRGDLFSLDIDLVIVLIFSDCLLKFLLWHCYPQMIWSRSCNWNTKLFLFVWFWSSHEVLFKKWYLCDRSVSSTIQSIVSALLEAW